MALLVFLRRPPCPYPYVIPPFPLAALSDPCAEINDNKVCRPREFYNSLALVDAWMTTAR